MSQVWILNKNALYLPQKFATYRASCHCLVNSLLTMGSWVAHIISYCIGYIRKCYFVFSSENVLHFCKLFCAIYTFIQPPFELLPSYEFDWYIPSLNQLGYHLFDRGKIKKFAILRSWNSWSSFGQVGFWATPNMQYDLLI